MAAGAACALGRPMQLCSSTTFHTFCACTLAATCLVVGQHEVGPHVDGFAPSQVVQQPGDSEQPCPKLAHHHRRMSCPDDGLPCGNSCSLVSTVAYGLMGVVPTPLTDGMVGERVQHLFVPCLLNTMTAVVTGANAGCALVCESPLLELTHVDCEDCGGGGGG
jgi:hypothetical protein